MKLQDALNSHKPYRKIGEKEWRIPWYSFQQAVFSADDVLADYEVRQEQQDEGEET